MRFLQLSEHQFRLFRFLDAHAKPSEWTSDVDFERGVVTFVETATKRPLLTTRLRLLGTFDRSDRTWMWGWAIDVAQQNPALVNGFAPLRASMKAHGRDEFERATAWRLDGDGAEDALVATTAGALGAWATYAFKSSPADGGRSVFVALDTCPEVERAPFDRRAQLTMLQTLLTRITFPFDWKRALDAYLGEPRQTVGAPPLVTYAFGDSTLRVTFDARGRIASLDATLGADAVSR